jgi:hypothetical protein
MIRRFIELWSQAPDGSPQERLYKRVALALGYGASLRRINEMSRQFKREHDIA